MVAAEIQNDTRKKRLKRPRLAIRCYKAEKEIGHTAG
jgi:hypothetical protein